MQVEYYCMKCEKVFISAEDFNLHHDECSGGVAPTPRQEATRTPEDNKLDYEGFLSPIALDVFCEYMNRHRVNPDGTPRDSDNWQRGIPIDRYRRSLVRHCFQAWRAMRFGDAWDETGNLINIDDALCGVVFNAMGLLHERNKAKRKFPRDER